MAYWRDKFFFGSGSCQSYRPGADILALAKATASFKPCMILSWAFITSLHMNQPGVVDYVSNTLATVFTRDPDRSQFTAQRNSRFRVRNNIVH